MVSSRSHAHLYLRAFHSAAQESVSVQPVVNHLPCNNPAITTVRNCLFVLSINYNYFMQCICRWSQRKTIVWGGSLLHSSIPRRWQSALVRILLSTIVQHTTWTPTIKVRSSATGTFVRREYSKLALYCRSLTRQLQTWSGIRAWVAGKRQTSRRPYLMYFVCNFVPIWTVLQYFLATALDRPIFVRLDFYLRVIYRLGAVTGPTFYECGILPKHFWPLESSVRA